MFKTKRKKGEGQEVLTGLDSFQNQTKQYVRAKGLIDLEGIDAGNVDREP